LDPVILEEVLQPIVEDRAEGGAGIIRSGEVPSPKRMDLGRDTMLVRFIAEEFDDRVGGVVLPVIVVDHPWIVCAHHVRDEQYRENSKASAQASAAEITGDKKNKKPDPADEKCE